MWLDNGGMVKRVVDRVVKVEPAAVLILATSSTRAAADVVDRWDLQTGVSDDVALVVSELMTNAVVHRRSDAVLRLLRQVGSVRSKCWTRTLVGRC